MFLNFMIMDINRNALRKRVEKSLQSKVDQLTRLVGDEYCDTGIAVCSNANGPAYRLANSWTGSPARTHRGKITREDKRCSGAIRAVDDKDRCSRQLNTFVVSGNSRIVPGRDLLLVDVRDHVSS